MNRAATILGLSAAFIFGLGYARPAASADLGEPRLAEPVLAPSPWSFTFTTYGWIPWMSGNMAVKGHNFDVNLDPSQIFGHLDWSTLPAWMSYAEARRGPISLFNDIVYANISGSNGLSRERPGPLGTTLSGSVSLDYTQVTIEFGGAYEIWSGRNPVVAGSSNLDLLAGGRYWHQDTTVTAATSTDPSLPILGGRVIDRSGSVDWVDPFIGARLRNQLGPGEELMVRADFGGFGVGSDFSWQVLATYNWQMCVLNGHILDGYVGYRALSVDYSQGSGSTRYEYDVLQQGPVIGSTLHF
jgi:hypothetical protein